MSDAMRDLIGLIVIVSFLWVVWFFTGGPEREGARGGIFLKPLAPVDSGETYGSLPFSNGDSKKQTNNTISEQTSVDLSLSNSIFISGHTGGKNYVQEYVDVHAENKNTSSVLITGWRIQNKSGFAAEIKNAVAVLLLGQSDSTGPIFLSPGERAYIATGRSPIGSSFKENICSGYLEQFQDFYPPIQKQCPSPLSDINISSETFDKDCVAYINNIERCQAPTDIPKELSATCRSFITTNINHNACVIKNQGTNNFYTGAWRIFLGLDRELWNNSGDTIRLIDSSGGMVDSKSY